VLSFIVALLVMLHILNVLIAVIGKPQQPTAQLKTFGFYGMIYILPYKVVTCQVPSLHCGDYWARTFGDRTYFYVYEDLGNYQQYIDEDFSIISTYYDTVVVIIPADDTEQYKSNLAIVNNIARNHNLKILWGIFPKWKYGPEYTYLDVGSAQYNLVVSVMQYLATLSQTYKIGLWYGWSNRCSYSDIETFYNSLPDNLKRLYALWLDEPFVKVLYSDLVNHNVEYFVVTELYTYDVQSTYTGKLRNQVVVTGFSDSQNLSQWYFEVCKRVKAIKCCPAIAIWIFYDKGDGTGEKLACYFPNEGLGNVKKCM